MKQDSSDPLIAVEPRALRMWTGTAAMSYHDFDRCPVLPAARPLGDPISSPVRRPGPAGTPSIRTEA